MRIDLTGYSTIEASQASVNMRKPGQPLIVASTEMLAFYISLFDGNNVQLIVEAAPVLYFHDHAGIRYKSVTTAAPTGAVQRNLWVASVLAKTLVGAHSYSVVIQNGETAMHEVINPTSIRIRGG